jgi:hypothetical protein
MNRLANGRKRLANARPSEVGSKPLADPGEDPPMEGDMKRVANLCETLVHNRLANDRKATFQSVWQRFVDRVKMRRDAQQILGKLLPTNLASATNT